MRIFAIFIMMLFARMAFAHFAHPSAEVCQSVFGLKKCPAKLICTTYSSSEVHADGVMAKGFPRHALYTFDLQKMQYFFGGNGRSLSGVLSFEGAEHWADRSNFNYIARWNDGSTYISGVITRQAKANKDLSESTKEIVASAIFANKLPAHTVITIDFLGCMMAE